MISRQLTEQDARVESQDWRVIPGRKVAHAMAPSFGGGLTAHCGQTRTYPADRLAAAGTNRRRCEQCIITIVSGVHTAPFKFFAGHVPTNIRVQRRKAWREYRLALRQPDPEA